MLLLHEVHHQRLRNRIILAVALLAAIASISPEQLGITLYKLSLVSIAAILGYHPDRALFPYASPGSYLIEDWKENLGKPVPVSRNEPEYPVATGYELICRRSAAMCTDCRGDLLRRDDGALTMIRLAQSLILLSLLSGCHPFFAASIQVEARQYQRELTRNARAVWGLNAPVPSLQPSRRSVIFCEGHYHRQVRRMLQIYQRNMEIYACWLQEFFPCGICVSRPKGCFMLWFELPEQVDMVCVAKQLCRLKILVASGSLFSASGEYRATAPCRQSRSIKS